MFYIFTEPLLPPYDILISPTVLKMLLEIRMWARSNMLLMAGQEYKWLSWNEKNEETLSNTQASYL